MKIWRRWKFRRRIRHLTRHEHAMRELRWMALYGGSHRKMLAQAHIAYDNALSGEEKQTARAWLDPLVLGRTIRTKGGGEFLSIDMVPVAIIDEINRIEDEV